MKSLFKQLLAVLALLALPGIAAAHGDEIDAPEGMTVELEVADDFRSGYNLRIGTENFRFTPEKAGEDNATWNWVRL